MSGGPPSTDSTTDHGSTNASHTAIAIGVSRSPGRRVATSSVAKTTAAHGIMNDFDERGDAQRDAEHDGVSHAVHRIVAQPEQSAERDERRRGVQDVRRRQLERRHREREETE